MIGGFGRRTSASLCKRKKNIKLKQKRECGCAKSFSFTRKVLISVSARGTRKPRSSEYPQYPARTSSRQRVQSFNFILFELDFPDRDTDVAVLSEFSDVINRLGLHHTHIYGFKSVSRNCILKV